MIAQLHWAYATVSDNPLTSPITPPVTFPVVTITPTGIPTSTPTVTPTSTPSATPTASPSATPTPTKKPQKPKPVKKYTVSGWLWYDVYALSGNFYQRVGERPAVNSQILVVDLATRTQTYVYTNQKGKFTIKLPTGFYYMEARDSQGLFAPFSRIAIVNQSNISGFNFWKNIFK